jgi:hypothetical protein
MPFSKLHFGHNNRITTTNKSQLVSRARTQINLQTRIPSRVQATILNATNKCAFIASYRVTARRNAEKGSKPTSHALMLPPRELSGPRSTPWIPLEPTLLWCK